MTRKGSWVRIPHGPPDPTWGFVPQVGPFLGSKDLLTAKLTAKTAGASISPGAEELVHGCHCLRVDRRQDVAVYPAGHSRAIVAH
jgi:hypothetical protein